MKLLSLVALLALIALTLADSEEERGPFCQKTCLKILPPISPPTAFTEDAIKKNDIKTQKFLNCFSKCFALYIVDGNNEDMQSKLKDQNFS